MQNHTTVSKKPYDLQAHIGFNGQVPLHRLAWTPEAGPTGWSESISNQMAKAENLARRFNSPAVIIAGPGYTVKAVLESLAPRNANVLETVTPPSWKPRETN
jgi:hypothetical protein